MILVTGGTGLVGSHLLFDLVKSGKKVRALKRSNSNIEFVRKIFSYYSVSYEELFSEIEWVDGDVLDIHSLYEAMDGVKEVYHCAAVVSFNSADISSMMKINIDGTTNIVNASLEKNVKKLCYVSSIASLGRAENNGITNEETSWKTSNDNSNYAISKYGGEREAWRGSAEGLDVVIVNPAIIMGPSNLGKGSTQLFSTVMDGLKFYTKSFNGYVDVRDVAKTMLLLMESNIKNERFIISSENLSYQTILNLISKNLRKNPPSIYANKFLREIAWRYEKLKSFITGVKPLITKETAQMASRDYFYSNKKIKNALNFEFIPISESVKDTCNFFLKDNKM